MVIFCFWTSQPPPNVPNLFLFLTNFSLTVLIKFVLIWKRICCFKSPSGFLKNLRPFLNLCCYCIVFENLGIYSENWEKEKSWLTTLLYYPRPSPYRKTPRVLRHLGYLWGVHLLYLIVKVLFHLFSGFPSIFSLFTSSFFQSFFLLFSVFLSFFPSALPLFLERSLRKLNF